MRLSFQACKHLQPQHSQLCTRPQSLDTSFVTSARVQHALCQSPCSRYTMELSSADGIGLTSTWTVIPIRYQTSARSLPVYLIRREFIACTVSRQSQCYHLRIPSSVAQRVSQTWNILQSLSTLLSSTRQLLTPYKADTYQDATFPWQQQPSCSSTLQLNCVRQGHSLA